MTTSDNELESVYGLPFPKVLALADRTRVVRYEPGLGLSASYANGAYTIGLYVYDLNLKDIPDDPTENLVVSHLHQSIAEAINVAQTRGEVLQCTGAYGVPYAGISVDYLVAKLSRAGDEGRLSSVILLTTKLGYFIKLRISFPEAAFSVEGLARTVGCDYFALLWPELKEQAHRIPVVGT